MEKMFLAEVILITVYSPGDDGMSEPEMEKISQIVFANNTEVAIQKIKDKYERYVPYMISVEVEVDKIQEAIL